MAEPTRPPWPAMYTRLSVRMALLIRLSDAIALAAHQRIAPCQREVGLDHLAHQLIEVDARRPAELGARLRGISEERVDLRRAKVVRIDAHDGTAAFAVDTDLLAPAAAPFNAHAEVSGRLLDEIAHRMLLAGGDHIVLWALLLQHEPLRLDVVARMAPVAARLQVAEVHAVLQPDADAREGAGDLARHERLAADRRLVVEEDPAAGVHSVRLAVIDRDPVCVELGDPIG